MAPQHSLAFIRPIQRDGADDNDSSCSPTIPPLCHSLLSCSPPLSDGLSLSFSFFFFFVPAFLSVTPLKTRNACRLLRGLRIGWGIEGSEGPPLFSFFDIFSPAPGFVSQVARIFFFFQLIVPFSNPSSMLLGWHHFKASASQRKSLSRPLTRLTISEC